MTGDPIAACLPQIAGHLLSVELLAVGGDMRALRERHLDWPPGSRRSRHVGELKRCQVSDDKVYEAIWDLFKMALMTRLAGVRTAHLITGATPTGSQPGSTRRS